MLFCSPVPVFCIVGAGIEPMISPARYGVLTTDVPLGTEEDCFIF
jgi:hypothetical protein